MTQASQSDFVSRGQALVAAGQFQEAVKVCRLGLLAKPNTVEGRVVLGQALLALKRYDEVLAEMRVALELDQTAAPAQILKGEALLRKGDTRGAIETLHLALAAAPGDPKVLQLLGQAEQASTQAPSTASHPATAFVAGTAETKHYPKRSEKVEDGEEDSGGGYTKPTSLSAPSSLRRSSQKNAVGSDGTPSAAELAVGDKSGTVEVDPDLDSVELGEELDFDALAAPPPGKASRIGGSRGSVRAPRAREGKREGKTIDASKKALDKKRDKQRAAATAELVEADVVEVGEVAAAPPSPPRKPGGTKVRDAVQLPSGPIDGPRPKPMSQPPSPPPALPLGPPPGGLAQTIAALPHVMQVAPPLAPHAPAPNPVPRIAAGMPTMAAAPPPGMLLGSPSALAAARPTIAIPPGPLPEAPPANVGPAWARATIAVVPGTEPRNQPAAYAATAHAFDAVDPRAASPVETASAPSIETPSASQRAINTGMRRVRSPLAVVMWIGIGVVVIGGGVFAGLQIRTMRLHKQIAAARDRANGLARAETWTGWTAALGSLAKIADASRTLDNRAALARARGLIAFEFFAGIDDAKAAVADLGGEGGLDGDLAATFVALAQNDPKAAKLAADAGLSRASQDPAAQYVAGEAALLAGDLKPAVTYLREATSHDARPTYGITLAEAFAAGNAWDDALGALDHVLQASPEHPGALIERARVLVASGRIATGSAAMDVRAQLDKVVAEGARPLAEQKRGVAPAQVAFADLALALVDQARGDATTSRGDVRAASSVGLEDVRFAEDAVETMFAIGDTHARAETDRALVMWPTDARIRLVLVRELLAGGRVNEALDTLAKPSDLSTIPLGLALRGHGKLALGDAEGARSDFDAALKKAPDLESALVGRAMLELASGDLDEARKLIEPHVTANGASMAITTTYASILRASGDPAQRAKARELLVKLVAAAPTVDTTRAELELARLERDSGEIAAAHSAYEQASKSGNFDARLENALLLIDDSKPQLGHDALEALLKDVGDPASPNLLLEVARARMLVGDHAGAKQALEAAGSVANVTRWKLERERGRLALRRGDFAGAAGALDKALDGCGSDAETFLLAADLAFGDDKHTVAVIDRVRKLAPDRLKAQPEAQVVQGKLLLAANKPQEAGVQFNAASKALETAKASNRRLAQPRFGEAVAKSELGQSRDALEELELVVTYDPALYAAYLFRAQLLQDSKQPKLALEIAQRGAQLDPDYADAWALVGELAVKAGDRKALASAIEKLTAIAPDSEALKELQHKH